MIQRILLKKSMVLTLVYQSDNPRFYLELLAFLCPDGDTALEKLWSGVTVYNGLLIGLPLVVALGFLMQHTVMVKVRFNTISWEAVLNELHSCVAHQCDFLQVNHQGVAAVHVLLDS